MYIFEKNFSSKKIKKIFKNLCNDSILFSAFKLFISLCKLKNNIESLNNKLYTSIL